MKIGVIVLAAGMSTRMGKPKMLMDWGEVSVIERVVQNYLDAGLHEIIVVAGANSEAIRSKLADKRTRVVINPEYLNGEMTTSLQVGLKNLSPEISSVMIALGDQPFLAVTTISQIREAYEHASCEILMPSINHRRGHPWIINKKLIGEILELAPPATLRDFLKNHEKEIHYLNVDDPSILLDMDTPEEYHKLKPV